MLMLSEDLYWDEGFSELPPSDLGIYDAQVCRNVDRATPLFDRRRDPYSHL